MSPLTGNILEKEEVLVLQLVDNYHHFDNIF